MRRHNFHEYMKLCFQLNDNILGTESAPIIVHLQYLTWSSVQVKYDFSKVSCKTTVYCMRVQICTCTQKLEEYQHEVARFLREYPHVRSVLHTTDDELISRIFSIFFNHKYSVHCIGFVQLKSVLCRSYFNFDSRTFTECRKMNRAQNLPSSSE